MYCHAAGVQGEFVGIVETGIEMIGAMGTVMMMEDRTDVGDNAIKVGINLTTNCRFPQLIPVPRRPPTPCYTILASLKCCPLP